MTTVLVQGREPSVISDYCREKCGVVLGRGIGELQGRAFRTAHMGHVNAPMVFGALGAIEMGLEALSIPRGRQQPPGRRGISGTRGTPVSFLAPGAAWHLPHQLGHRAAGQQSPN